MNEDFLQHYAWVKQIDAQALATRCVSVTWEKVLKLVMLAVPAAACIVRATDNSIRKTEILCMVISHSFMKMSKSLLYAGESMDSRLRTEWKM